MELVIDRARWIRGKINLSDEGSRLLDSHGNMCCLGFYCLACGLPKEDIRGLATLEVEDLDGKLKIDDRIADKESFYEANDCKSYGHMTCSADIINSEEDRETALTKKFKRHGVELKFIN